MQDVGREQRQERDRATEEDREEVERHRAEERRVRMTYRIPMRRLSIIGSPSTRSGIGLRAMRLRQSVATANRTAIPAYVAGRPTSATAMPPTAGPAIEPVWLTLLMNE